MRTDQNLQVINAIAQKNFNPALLEKYTGFGGIGRKLAEYDYYKKLNSIIPKDEIAKIIETTKTAYYTPELLVRFIYKALENLGFRGGHILSDKRVILLSPPSPKNRACDFHRTRLKPFSSH